VCAVIGVLRFTTLLEQCSFINTSSLQFQHRPASGCTSKHHSCSVFFIIIIIIFTLPAPAGLWLMQCCCAVLRVLLASVIHMYVCMYIYLQLSRDLEAYLPPEVVRIYRQAAGMTGELYQWQVRGAWISHIWLELSPRNVHEKHTYLVQCFETCALPCEPGVIHPSIHDVPWRFTFV
jgi:hypothetical protein